ncbi:Nitrogen permease regulator 3-like protein [Hypsibius exemplaris]|uniref:GATOR complex protein NPRL3 n=1 Tax=Hypsibius exemplaris TaxID=2072580 RepID=A0A1W0X478_HYPEX|nr:Nitrogen permease regulator 3-like protein [Hypsibius exemplaris]
MGSVMDPLGIFFAITGTKGNKLLFRYPFENTESRKTRGINPYSLIVTEDVQNNRSNSPDSSADSKRSSRSSSLVEDVGAPSGTQRLRSLTDKTLEHIFAYNIKPALYNQKFEVKIDDILFVGHPMQVPANGNRSWRANSGDKSTADSSQPPLTPTSNAPPSTRDTNSSTNSANVSQSGTSMFHVVFALRAEDITAFIVESYHRLSLKLALAVSHEEERCQYLAVNVKSLNGSAEFAENISANALVKTSPYSMALEKNPLAILLQRVYDDLVRDGTTSVRVNDWVQVNFCLLPRIHRNLDLSEAALTEHVMKMRPYHGLLLLDEQDVTNDLPIDSSSTLVRFIRIVSPLSNFQQLAMEAGVTLKQIFSMAGHLIYWAKARLIFPVCETNVYALSSDASTKVLSDTVDEFARRFSDLSLLEILSDFSMPQPMRDMISPFSENIDTGKLTQIVIWCLRKELLMQLHTFVYLVPQDVQDLHYLQNESLNWLSLPYAIRDTINAIPAAAAITEDGQPSELVFFMKIIPYLRGRTHLEEMMFNLNVKRSQLTTVLDKFREVLVTTVYEDPNIQNFHKTL